MVRRRRDDEYDDNDPFTGPGYCDACQERFATESGECEDCMFNWTHPWCTLETYKAMFAAQGGRCAICGTDKPCGATPRKRLCVDHSHVTGEVRGLLCVPCNAGVGMLRDDPAVLDRAAAYLRTHGAGA